MRIESLLNLVYPLKSFVYTECRLELHEDRLLGVATIKPRKNGGVFCSGCAKRRKLYDRLEIRHFDFVP